MLEKALKALIDLYSIEQINDALCTIFEEKMNHAYDKKDDKAGLLFDELSGFYDEINLTLVRRPFRDDIREQNGSL